MRIARPIAAIGLVLALSSPVLVTTAPTASADTPGCVSAAEYRKVRNGMTRGAVHRLFDTKGKKLFENPGRMHNSAREYKMCAAFRRATGDRKVQIQYNNYATRGGPQRVVHKQHY